MFTKLVLPLLLILSLPAYALSLPPAGNAITVGGALSSAAGATYPYGNAGGSIVLTTGDTAPSAGAFYPLYRQDNGAPYRVSAGKTFVANGYYFFGSGAAGGDRFQFVVATNTFTRGSSSQPTGFIPYSGAAGRGNHTNSSAASYVYYPIPVSISGNYNAAVEFDTATDAQFVDVIGQETTVGP